MTEDWEKAKKIFNDAVKVAPEMRLRFLDENCDDIDLRREVESLLASYDEAESFMESPAAEEVAEEIAEGSRNLEKGKSFGHYEIVSQIGVGGMGKVYLAKDTRLDRQVAVKILNEKYSRHKSNLDRFIQEAKAASALNHPNILVIHEIGEAENAHYIVSEYISGKTLREVFNNKTLTIGEILDIAVQIANALAAAHEAHLVHRDIKPENIMVRPDGYAKILDFGLAKLVGQKALDLENSTVKQNQTAKGIILGTVNYMSPEQAKGERIDERTDIFSLGVVLYEMLAGQTPFAGDSVSETFANLINKEPPPLSRFTADVPDELQRIISKTLRKKKDERYQTMKDLFSDLKSLQKRLEFEIEFELKNSLETDAETEELATKNQEFLSSAETDKNTEDTNTGHSFNKAKETDEKNYSNRTLQITESIKNRKYFYAVGLMVLIAAAGFSYYFWSAKNTALINKKTLAVLPFINTSQDPNAEYLSDGVTESIINNLSQLSGLKVISKNSSFRFKDSQSDIKNIASQLGVETLLTGEIKQLGDKLIINIRLIDARDDSQIWGNQYIKTSTDILAAQNEIAQAVAQNLRVKLSISEQQQLAKRPTENAEAYQLYLRGRFHVFKLTPPEINKGISYFGQAIDLDPNYALAFAGISDAYRSLAIGSELSPTENLPKAKAAALKAIEIDETLSEGYSALGATDFWLWNWNTAESNFKRALELNSNDVNAHLFYAHFLSNMGRHAEALNEVKLARELDPLFPFVGALEGQFLNHAGRTDEALDRLQKTLELAPNFWMPHLFASSVYIEKGMFTEAIAEAHKATELSPAQTVSIAFEGYALAKSGRRDEAQNLLDKLLKLSTERFIPPNHIAFIYNGLGETDKTLDWLEKGYEEHDPKMAFLKVEPKWVNLRSEPRFIELMRRMNFE